MMTNGDEVDKDLFFVPINNFAFYFLLKLCNKMLIYIYI